MPAGGCWLQESIKFPACMLATMLMNAGLKSGEFPSGWPDEGKVYLISLMSVAGDHTKSDLAGNEPEGWKSILTRNGYRCETVLKGTADYPQIVAVWLNHLRTVLGHF